jgi:translation initiation factor 3 subunit E
MDADADTNARVRSALWGQYMCEVLLGERDASKYALDQLHQMLDDRAADEANKARADLLHWGLFHWFKNRETSAFLDLLFTFDKADRSKTYLYANVAQCMAPHLLRYIAIAAVLNKKKRATLTRAARILDGDAYHYTDVFTRFLVELCVRTDFTKATALLAECDKALADDYFAADLRKDFVANARQMLFEDQLRVRKSLSISSAATQLGMTSDEAELWLVDLIREAKLDAAVDSVAGTVRVSGTAMQKTVWQHVLDRLENASGGKAAMM